MSVEATKFPKILIVDDEPDHLDLLYRTFYQEYEVLQARSAASALEILASRDDIAVIITDQRMPQMSGTEFLSITATQYPDVIRIIITAYSDVEDLVEAINSGQVFKYVTKPWNAQELKQAVRQAVETHSLLKRRTRELRRTLRQESLLNAVTNTIRSALSYRQILQTIVETVGQMFEVSYCLLRPVSDEQGHEDPLIYTSRNSHAHNRHSNGSNSYSPIPMVPASQAEPKTDAQSEQLLKTVWETQDVIVANDASSDERIQASPERAQAYRDNDIRSSLIVPLCSQQYGRPQDWSVLAVLALHQCGEERVWQDDEIQLVVMVADQAALTLSQARAYEQVRALAQREALINSITSAIRSSLEPREIFAAITEQLGQALQVDGCALSLWTAEDEYVQCVGLYERQQTETSDEHQPIRETGEDTTAGSPGRAQGLPTSRVPITGNTLLQQLLQTQKPVAINDINNYSEEEVFDAPFRVSAKALLVVPLLVDGQIIGSISLRQADRSRHWVASEIDLAEAVAAQAAIAVQHARLYQKTKQQAERLLALDRQKTEFFQNISHEFRTPLTLMMGPLEAAANSETGLPPEQAAIALRNSRRLLRMVNQLLDLHRLDAGKMQPRFRPCRLENLLRQIIDAFHPYCERKGLNLKANLQECPSVYIDLEKFDKVLYNLFSNAMKFTASGGEIAVGAKHVGGYCLIQIADTGIGIPPDQIPYLFDRFRQGDSATDRAYEGSGLGLAVAKELVELHGGQITVDSVEGEGSTFTIWLPTGCAHLPPEQVIEVPAESEIAGADVELADLETELQDSATTTDASTSQTTEIPNWEIAPELEDPEQKKILFVDDNADLRTYVASILKGEGYQVLLARNGAEGIQVTHNYHPDLIVADLMMPVVSGLDMISMLREEERFKGIPIVLLTAKVNEDTRIEGVEKGADAYLSKPFNDRELLAEVRNLLSLKENERRVAQLNRYLTESVLRRFLPPSMVEKAATGELSLDLRPEPRLITILFSDIVGFTELANNLRSRRVAQVLNEYLAEMTAAVFQQGGTVDKFVGDAVMALYGAPEDLTPNEQIHRAIESARQMHRSLAELNRRWRAEGLPQVRFRCGIHQGTAVVGMFGGTERSDYTAIGPSVNIAARLQEAADPDAILVSAAVADYLEDDEITKFRSLKLKGLDETVLAFTVTPTDKNANPHEEAS
jgi:adenylate cyclase